MRFLTIFMILFSSLATLPALATTIAENFVVREIEAGKATLEGKVKDVKVGDKLYSGFSPFQFEVDSIKDNQVVIRVPESVKQIKAGSIILREATDSIKKSINTEARLKEALAE